VTLADRLAAAYAEALQVHAARSPGRFSEEVDGLQVISLGLPERWSNAVLALTGRPDPRAVTSVLGWLAARGLDGQVFVRERDAAALTDLSRIDALPVFAVSTSGPAALGSASLQSGPRIEGERLDVAPAASAADFTGVYSSAFEMRPGMAESLVIDADIGAPGLVHLIGRVAGEVVACAMLRPAGGLGYVSAVGVLPVWRGRGIGTAMLATCADRSADAGCEVLWLHAAAGSAAFYEGIGFELVDTHVALA
jgi:ribosomal protein S18 acetylase RimI-like enzyme